MDYNGTQRTTLINGNDELSFEPFAGDVLIGTHKNGCLVNSIAVSKQGAINAYKEATEFGYITKAGAVPVELRQLKRSMETRYLGDSIYARVNSSGAIVIFTNNGESMDDGSPLEKNAITMETVVVRNLVAMMDRFETALADYRVEENAEA